MMRPSRQQPYVPGLQILISSTLVSTITDDMIPFVRICRRDDGRWADTKGMPSAKLRLFLLEQSHSPLQHSQAAHGSKLQR